MSVSLSGHLCLACRASVVHILVYLMGFFCAVFVRLPLLRHYFDEKSIQPIIKQIVKKSTPATIGWFLRPMPSDEVRNLLSRAHVPPTRYLSPQARLLFMKESAGMPRPVISLIMMPAYRKVCLTRYSLSVQARCVSCLLLDTPPAFCST